MRITETVLNVIRKLERRSGEPGAVKIARPVRRGAVGKVPKKVTHLPPTLLQCLF